MYKKTARLRRATRARKAIQNLCAVRCVVHRTSRHIYAQIIGPDANVIVTASTVDKAIRRTVGRTSNINAAKVVGKTIAERSLARGISKVAFDRSGFQYHGRIAGLADAAREAGLQF